MPEMILQIKNKVGLHARPASLFVQEARRYTSNIRVTNGDTTVNGKSILNVLTLGARFTGEGLALEIVRAWLGTDWGAGRHAARVEKITDVERRYASQPVEGRAR